MSPVLGIVILVFVTLAMAALTAPVVYDSVSQENSPEGVEVTFSESRDGSVNVKVIDMGTADNISVNTNHRQQTIKNTGQTVSVYPGEGEITIISAIEDVRQVSQTYNPKWGPDSPLAAIISGDLHKNPGQEYSLNASESLGNITSYRWDFNQDGTTDATGETVTKAWNNPGIYDVELTVEDNNGNTHTSTVTIINSHLIVAQDGTGDYEKIQWAIDNSSVGWSIYVKDTGQYEETVTANRASLTVFSDEYATINGGFMTDSTAGLNITKDNIEIRGLRISQFTNGAAVKVNSSADDVTLTNLYVDESGNESVYGGALYIERGASGSNISESRILSNGGTCAITLGDENHEYGGPYTTIDDTKIRSNSGHGLCAYDSVRRLDLIDSTFEYNNKHGVFLGDGDNMEVSDTKFRRNGISADSSDAAVFVSNSKSAIFNRITVVDNDDTGLNTHNNSENISVKNSVFESNEGHGVVLDDLAESELKNVSSQYNTGYGVNLLNDTHNLTINQSRLNANNRSGIFVANKSNNITLGNVSVMKNTEHGAFLNRTDDIFIQDGNFTDNGGSEGEFHGVYIKGTSGNNENITVRYSHLYGTNQSEEEIVAGPSAETIDAQYNWWGANETPTTDQYSGDIIWDPICEDADCTGSR